MANKNFKDYEDFFANVQHDFSEDVKNAKKEIIDILQQIPTDTFAEEFCMQFKITCDGCFSQDHFILQSQNKAYCNKVLTAALEGLTSTKKAKYIESSSLIYVVGHLKFSPLI